MASFESAIRSFTCTPIITNKTNKKYKGLLQYHVGQVYAIKAFQYHVGQVYAIKAYQYHVGQVYAIKAFQYHVGQVYAIKAYQYHVGKVYATKAYQYHDFRFSLKRKYGAQVRIPRLLKFQTLTLSLKREFDSLHASLLRLGENLSASTIPSRPGEPSLAQGVNRKGIELPGKVFSKGDQFMTMRNTNSLHPINPEVGRTYHSQPFDRVTVVNTTMHSVAISHSVHYEHMTQPPTPQRPGERTASSTAENFDPSSSRYNPGFQNNNVEQYGPYAPSLIQQ
ncbi:hypothetical protein Lal_00042381 [Lupinus albus]|nr:hypothetical protein Lal_00042381 [Lupinus albus]